MTSGIESHRITWLPEPALTEAHTPEDRAIDREVNGTDELVTGVEGRDEKAAWPEYREPE